MGHDYRTFGINTQTSRVFSAAGCHALAVANSCNYCAATVLVASLVGTAAAQPVLVPNRFDAGSEGWTAIDVPVAQLCNEPGSGATQPSAWRSTGGHPGGYFFYQEPSNTGIDPLMRVVPIISGDPLAALGGFIRFDRRMIQAGNFDFAITDDLYMQGVVNGATVTLIANTLGVPYSTWQPHRVALRSGTWRVGSCSGPIATSEEIAAVLAGLTTVKIKAEYRSGAEDHGIDNFMLVGPGDAVITTFELSTDDWTVTGDVNQFGWIETEGVQNVRCIRVVDAVQGAGISFVAPAAFLGDKSAFLDKTMELDLRSSVGLGAVQADGGSGGFVTLRSGTFQLNYRNNNFPIVGNAWRHHAIPLSPSPNWTRGSDGAQATQEDFVTVLSNLTRVTVRGEFETGGETNYLDNVVFGACSPSAVAAPESARACIGQSVTLTAFPSGDGPFSFRWTRAGVEIDAEATGNPSAATSTLVLTGMQPADVGTYRCIVSNACGSVTSNPVAVRLNTADFNNDGDTGTDSDIEAFFACLAGNCCPACASADFNADGDTGTDSDIEAFFRVLAGQPC